MPTFVHLPSSGYTEAMEGLLAKIEGTPRLIPLLPLIDRERLIPRGKVPLAA